MPTPSFDELLSQAREIADSQRGPRTGELIAKGVSDFVANILNSAGSERKTYAGYLSPEGKFNSISPYSTGGSLPQVLADRVSNGGAMKNPIPQGSFPLSQDQAGEFSMKSALEKQRSTGETERTRIRAQAMIDAAKQRGSRGSGGVLSSPVPEVVRNAVYDEMERRMGTIIDPENRTPLTLAHLREFRQEGYIGDEFTQKMIPILKDRILGLPQDAIDKVFSMAEQYNTNRFPEKQPAAPKGSGKNAFSAGGGQPRQIRVEVISGASKGQTGSIPENEFDAKLYKKI